MAEKKAVVARSMGLGTSLSWTLVLIGAALVVGLSLWLVSHPEYGAGRVLSCHGIPGMDRELLWVGVPGLERRAFVVEGKPGAVSEGQWILAKGERLVTQEGRDVLRVRGFHTFPVSPDMALASDERWPGSLEAFFKEHRGVSTAVGVAVLTLGFFFARAASSLLLGLVGAWLGWHVVVLAGFLGYLDLRVEIVLGGTALGFLAGAYLGFRRESVLGYLFQHLGLILILWALHGQIAEVFQCPISLVRGVVILGSLLSLPLGLWILSSYFLVVGIAESIVGAGIVLAVTLVIVHVLCRGKWIHWPFLGRSKLRRAPARGHEVSIGELVGR